MAKRRKRGMTGTEVEQSLKNMKEGEMKSFPAYDMLMRKKKTSPAFVPRKRAKSVKRK